MEGGGIKAVGECKSIGIDYYNNKIEYWEPFIEPWELVIKYSQSHPSFHTPNPSITSSWTDSPQRRDSTDTARQSASLKNTQFKSLEIQSSKINVNLSQICIELIKNSTDSWKELTKINKTEAVEGIATNPWNEHEKKQEEMKKKSKKREKYEIKSPYKIRNETGTSILYKLSSSSSNSFKNVINGGEETLFFTQSTKQEYQQSKWQEKMKEINEKLILMIENENKMHVRTKEFPINRVGKYAIEEINEKGEKYQIGTVEIRFKKGSKYIIIRSNYMIKNGCNCILDILISNPPYYSPILSTISPNKCFFIPISLFISSIHNQSMIELSVAPHKTHQFSEKIISFAPKPLQSLNEHLTSEFHLCKSEKIANQASYDYFTWVTINKMHKKHDLEVDFMESSRMNHSNEFLGDGIDYFIHILPIIYITNYLPVDLEYILWDNSLNAKSDHSIVHSNQKLPIYIVNPLSPLSLILHYLNFNSSSSPFLFNLPSSPSVCISPPFFFPFLSLPFPSYSLSLPFPPPSILSSHSVSLPFPSYHILHSLSLPFLLSYLPIPLYPIPAFFLSIQDTILSPSSLFIIHSCSSLLPSFYPSRCFTSIPLIPSLPPPSPCTRHLFPSLLEFLLHFKIRSTVNLPSPLFILFSLVYLLTKNGFIIHHFYLSRSPFSFAYVSQMAFI